jgi:glutamine cyclotransferase
MNYLKQKAYKLRYDNRTVRRAFHSIKQKTINSYRENSRVFSQGLEAQRHEIVETVGI